MEIGLKKAPRKPPGDHRSRVGAERREKTRERLIESALLVFTQHGLDAGVIDKVIRTAMVSRGTFYNYFRTDEDVFIAVGARVSKEILTLVDPLVTAQADAAGRVACGMRLVLAMARETPMLAEFLVRGGPRAFGHGSLVNEVVVRDLALGLAAGTFKSMDLRVAHDLVLGPVQMAFHRILSGDLPADYAESMTRGVLRSLGVAPARAAKLAALSYGPLVIAADSIFNRARLRALD